MNNRLKPKQQTLSPQDNLPWNIGDLEELIKKISRKITINSTASNLQNLFPWIELVEKILKRYNEYDDEMIINLQHKLAKMMFKKMNKAFLILSKIKGSDDIETNRCKNICGKMLVILKQYEKMVNYLLAPFAIASGKVSGEEELFILLDYEEDITTAPEIIISQKGTFAKKLLKIAEKKNIPLIEDQLLANGLMKDCEQLEPILPEYFDRVAKIIANTETLKIKALRVSATRRLPRDAAEKN